MKSSQILLLLLAVVCSSGMGPHHKKARRGRRMRCTTMQLMEEKLSSLQKQMDKLSSPVNVYVRADQPTAKVEWRTEDKEESSEEEQDMSKASGEEKSSDKTSDEEKSSDKTSGEEKASNKTSGDEKDSNKMSGDKKASNKTSTMIEEKSEKRKAGEKGDKFKEMKHKDHHKGKEDDEDDDESKSSESSEEDREEEEEDEKKESGTHIHIHLNIGGQEQVKPAESQTLSLPEDEYVYARCDVMKNSVLNSRHNVRGTVLMRQKPNEKLEVQVSLSGFHAARVRAGTKDMRNMHGIHVHQFGDTSKGCNSMGGHFNPTRHNHGGPAHEHRHIGDWGNIESDRMGMVKTTFTEKMSSLLGPHSIVGRGIVIHGFKDDHGLGGTQTSLASGSAGPRIACCVVAWGPPGDNW